MNIRFRITRALLNDIHGDLDRAHSFAFERVGFISCRVGSTDTRAIVLTACHYFPVADGDYLRDRNAGAVIGRSAFRKAMEISYREPVGIFHVHRHEHLGRPWFSPLDLRETAKFVPDFWHVRPEMPHGALVLSRDKAVGLCWYPGRRAPVRIKELWAVGGYTGRL